MRSGPISYFTSRTCHVSRQSSFALQWEICWLFKILLVAGGDNGALVLLGVVNVAQVDEAHRPNRVHDVITTPPLLSNSKECIVDRVDAAQLMRNVWRSAQGARSSTGLKKQEITGTLDSFRCSSVWSRHRPQPSNPKKFN
jgi:hypothetical protein